MEHSLGQILDRKSNHGKILKTEIISSILYDHNAIRLYINLRKKKNYKKHKHMEAIQQASE